jgi:hypothetical protein
MCIPDGKQISCLGWQPSHSLCPGFYNSGACILNLDSEDPLYVIANAYFKHNHSWAPPTALFGKLTAEEEEFIGTADLSHKVREQKAV